MTQTSLTFTVATSFDGTAASRIEYALGRNTRSESCGRAKIYNRELCYRFELDLAGKIYRAYRTNEYGSPKWVNPLGREPLKQSGQTTHIQTENIDTGERRRLFGYAARHVVTRSRATRDLRTLSESECDGWYIDPPAAWLLSHPPPRTGYTFSPVFWNG